MCDYSLMHVKSRAANVGDKLTTGSIQAFAGECGTYPTTTRGLFDEKDTETAVCLLPGTEVGFKSEPIRFLGVPLGFKRTRVATFTQINKDNAMTHHDALEFADGEIKLIHDLEPGQKMTVLVMPVDREAAEAKKLAVVA